MICPSFTSMSIGEEASSISRLRLWVIPWVLTLLTAFVWLCAANANVSQILVQGFGLCILLALGLPLVTELSKRPEAIARPIYVFFLGCIYFFVLDMALLREVEEFSPEVVLVADTVVVVFLVTVIGTWCLFPLQHSPLTGILRQADGSLTGNIYFRLAVVAFGLEYLRRLYFVDWSLSSLLNELLLAKVGAAGGERAFSRGVAGDWRFVLEPITVFFLGVAFFAERAWKYGISRLKKVVLLIVVMAQLGSYILEGSRRSLLLAVLLSLFVRAAQQDRVVGQWLSRLILATFLLAPLMDTMVKVRGYGWFEISQVEGVSWNIVQAHRDNNFHWVVNLVDFLQRDRGILAYKSPLGFVEGVQELGWLWLIMPIPRVFWPGKPLATEMGDETRPWTASSSIAGTLLRYGGVTFVVFGGILLGLWLRLLEPLFQLPKNDGAAIAYTFLLVFTLVLIRDPAPWSGTATLLIFLLVVIGWAGVRFLQRLSAELAGHTRSSG
jgi:hypothetical protein